MSWTIQEKGLVESSIMPSLDPNDLMSEIDFSLPFSRSLEVSEFYTKNLTSLNPRAKEERKQSFLLMNEEEAILFEDSESFALRLGTSELDSVKVLSIIGNTGVGKSHTLNQTLFEGKEIFCTSPSPESCTLGVWAAFEPQMNVIALDTEGLGAQSDAPCNEKYKLRQLLKILALSDIVIYRTTAERLHSDMFIFLGDASKAYNEHFSEELKKYGTHSLGPVIIIYHETRYTSVYDNSSAFSLPENLLRQKFDALHQDISAFSKLRYLGIQNTGSLDILDICQEEKSTEKLRVLVKSELEDISVRSPRKVSLIFKALKVLNDKFNNELSSHSNHRSFPDEYFTCCINCLSCSFRCSKAINHEGPHSSSEICRYQKAFDNKNYLCLRCYQNGRRILVVPKASSSSENSWMGLATYAWSGFVLECSVCGVLYRSRAHWYGNKGPETHTVVQTEISHIWPGERSLQGTVNAAQRLLDGVTLVSESVKSLTNKIASTKTMTDWMNDRIAPDYWRPNSDIIDCHSCKSNLCQLGIHHCRQCGEGFCEPCSNYKIRVPERGWGNERVRVCKSCYSNLSTSISSQQISVSSKIQTRALTEKVAESLFSLTSAVLDYPIHVIKDSARPSYWIPDEEIEKCYICSMSLNHKIHSSSSKVEAIHHCRKCGQGVCKYCSMTQKSVPERGWDYPVRVCDKC